MSEYPNTLIIEISNLTSNLLSLRPSPIYFGLAILSAFSLSHGFVLCPLIVGLWSTLRLTTFQLYEKYWVQVVVSQNCNENQSKLIFIQPSLHFIFLLWSRNSFDPKCFVPISLFIIIHLLCHCSTLTTLTSFWFWCSIRK